MYVLLSVFKNPLVKYLPSHTLISIGYLLSERIKTDRESWNFKSKNSSIISFYCSSTLFRQREEQNTVLRLECQCLLVLNGVGNYIVIVKKWKWKTLGQWYFIDVCVIKLNHLHQIKLFRQNFVQWNKVKITSIRCLIKSMFWKIQCVQNEIKH